MRTAPCETCEIRDVCKTHYFACDAFLWYAGVIKGLRGRKPSKIPTAEKYNQAFPADRARLGRHEIKSFGEIINNVRECA